MICGYFLANRHLGGRLAIAIGFSVLLYAAFRGRYLRQFFSNRWITATGGMCYSIYLLHVPLIYGFGKLTKHAVVSYGSAANAAIQLSLLFPPVLCACAVYYYFVERPFMHFSSRKSRGAGLVVSRGAVCVTDEPTT